MRSVASSAGVSGVHAGKKFGFDETTTDTESIFTDPEANTLVITTRHDSHARFVIKALKTGKNVFMVRSVPSITLPTAANLFPRSDLRSLRRAECCNSIILEGSEASAGQGSRR